MFSYCLFSTFHKNTKKMQFFQLKTSPIEDGGPFNHYPTFRPNINTPLSDRLVTYTDFPLTLYRCLPLTDILPCWNIYEGILINDKVRQLIESFHFDPSIYRLIQLKLHYNDAIYDYYWLPCQYNVVINPDFDFTLDNNRNFCLSQPLKKAFEQANITGCTFGSIETIEPKFVKNPPPKKERRSRSKEPFESLDVCVLKTKSVEYLTKDKRYIQVKAEIIHGELRKNDYDEIHHWYYCFSGRGANIATNLNYFEKTEDGCWLLELRKDFPIELIDIADNSLVFCAYSSNPNFQVSLNSLDKTFYKSEVRKWLKDKISKYWTMISSELHWKNLNTTQSRLLGYPSVPDNFQYPHTNEGIPLAFLCQLNLSELKLSFQNLKDFLKGGTLVFFLDLHNSEKGWPEEKDRFKVYHFPEGTPLSILPFPKGLEVMKDISPLLFDFTENIDWDSEPFRKLDYNSTDEVDLHLLFINNIFEMHLDKSRHHYQLLGFPLSVQGDVRVEAERLSRGNTIWPLSTDPDYQSKVNAIYKDYTEHRNDWQLLLQIENASRIGLYSFLTDPAIYFVIRKTDLANNNFDNVQVILQGT
jgi:uncharacterized protein YwqG